MSTSSINAINIQVWAESVANADKSSGDYYQNISEDRHYYLWHSNFQTIPRGMDGEPERFASGIREALPEVNTLRIPFNYYTFNEDGSINPLFERFLSAAASEGFNIIFCYSDGDIQKLGGDDGLSSDEIYSELSGQAFSRLENSWSLLADWLSVFPNVEEAVWGCEVANEPAAYARGQDMEEGTRFVELYAESIMQVVKSTLLELETKILVGGWRHSAIFEDLTYGSVNGQTPIEAIRNAVGEQLVWSSHLYPGWVGTVSADNPSEVKEILEKIYAPLGSDEILITETNAKGSLVDNPQTLDSPDAVFVRAYEWFAERGIGAAWFPGVETGASHFLSIEGNGAFRYSHPNSLAHGLNFFSLDEEPAENQSDETVFSEKVSAKLRLEEYQRTDEKFIDAVGAGFGFGFGGNDTIQGGDEFVDFLYGGTGNDSIFGFGNTDFLFGQYGDDFMDGGDGSDYLFGGEGDDTLLGGEGDQISGGEGSDTFVVRGGNCIITDFSQQDKDQIFLGGFKFDSEGLYKIGVRGDLNGDGAADDLLVSHSDYRISFVGFFNFGISLRSSTSRDDYLFGSGGDDVLRGLRGHDVLSGESGDDTVFGGWGNDTLIGGSGDDHLDGGGGMDMVKYSTSIADCRAWREGQFIYIESEWGVDKILSIEFVTFSDATVTAQSLISGSAEQYIHGSSASETFFGGYRSDKIFGGAGNDKVHGLSGSDTLSGGFGSDRVYGGNGDDSVFGGSGKDRLIGGNGADKVLGGSGDDRLYGGAGDDSVFGGSGRDYLFGGDGDDRLLGRPGNDRGYGGDGDDSLFGGSGKDCLFGGSGADKILGGSGADWLYGGAGSDSLFGGSGKDVLFGGFGNDTVLGGKGNDTVVGNDGSDFLDGEFGNDTLIGGAGADTFHFRFSTGDLDVIKDFDFGVDKIEMLGASQVLTRNVQDGVELDFLGHVVFLEGVFSAPVFDVDIFLI